MIRVRTELYIDRAQAQQIAEQGFDALRPDLLTFANDAAQDFSQRMRRRLSLHGGGRIYKLATKAANWARIKVGGVIYTASAPGQAPAPFTDEYRDSYRTDVRSLKRSVQGRIAAVNFGWLAWILEYGSRFMKPRPHVRPVFNEWAASLNSQISRGE